jgi:hypothetical protein
MENKEVSKRIPTSGVILKKTQPDSSSAGKVIQVQPNPNHKASADKTPAGFK